METYVTNRWTPAETARWWAIGLWLRLAIVGGMLVPTGLLIAVEGRVAGGLAAALAGAALAAVASARVKRAMAAAEADEPVGPSVPRTPAPPLAGRPARA